MSGPEDDEKVPPEKVAVETTLTLHRTVIPGIGTVTASVDRRTWIVVDQILDAVALVDGRVITT